MADFSRLVSPTGEQSVKQVILVCCDDKAICRHAHSGSHPPGKNIPEITCGHNKAKVPPLAFSQLVTSMYIVDALCQDPDKVDGIHCREIGPGLELKVSKEFLDDILCIIK